MKTYVVLYILMLWCTYLIPQHPATCSSLVMIEQNGSNSQPNEHVANGISHQLSKEFGFHGDPTMPNMYIDTNCSNDRTYSSLKSCMEECRHKPPVSVLSRIPALDTTTDSVTHKIVVINDFIIDNGYLHSTLLGTFNDSVFTVHNKSAFICYPLAPEFVACDKWLMNSFEYEINTDLSAWVKPYKQYYNLNEYYFTTSDYLLVICIPDNSQSIDKLSAYHLTGYILSAVSLIVAFITSFFVKGVKKQSNRPLQCHMIMLFLGYAVVSLKFANFSQKHEIVCVVFASLQQFCFLSAFFWINSQAIDLYIALKDLRPDCHASIRRKRRFLLYCLYSWGIPMVITAMTLTAEITQYPHLSVLYPGFQFSCWFEIGNQISAFIFYYGWMAIVIVMNAILFSLIVMKFQKMGQEVFIANRNIHKQLLRISIKLVIVMGFFWVIKVTIWAVGRISLVGSILDIVTTLQGFFIFLVYICKPKIIKSCLRLNNHGLVISDTASSNNRKTRMLTSFLIFTSGKSKTNETSFSSSPFHSKLTFVRSSILSQINCDAAN